MNGALAGLAMPLGWMAMVAVGAVGCAVGATDPGRVAQPEAVGSPGVVEAPEVAGAGVEREADRVFEVAGLSRVDNLIISDDGSRAWVLGADGRQRRLGDQRLVEVSLDAGVVVRELPLPGEGEGEGGGAEWSAGFLAADAAAGVLVGRLERAVPTEQEHEEPDAARQGVIFSAEPRPREEARVVWNLADGEIRLLRRRDLPPVPLTERFARRVQWRIEPGADHIWQVDRGDQAWVLSRLPLATLEPEELWRHPTLEGVQLANVRPDRAPLWGVNAARQRLYLITEEDHDEQRLVPWLTVVDLATGEQVLRRQLHDRYVGNKMLDGRNERMVMQGGQDWLRTQLEAEGGVNLTRVLDVVSGDSLLDIATPTGRYFGSIRPRAHWRYVFLTDSANHRRIIWRLDTASMTWSWPRRVPSAGPVRIAFAASGERAVTAGFQGAPNRLAVYDWPAGDRYDPEIAAELHRQRQAALEGVVAAATPVPEHRLDAPWPGPEAVRGEDRTVVLAGAQRIRGMALSGDGRLAWMAVLEPAREEGDRDADAEGAPSTAMTQALWLYDLDDDRLVRRVEMPEAITAASDARQIVSLRPMIAGEGRWLILAAIPQRLDSGFGHSTPGPSRYYVWDGDTGELVGERSTAEDVAAVASITPDGQRLRVHLVRAGSWRMAFWSLPTLAGEPVLEKVRLVERRWDASRLGKAAPSRQTVSGDGERLVVAMRLNQSPRRDPLLPAPVWVQTFDAETGAEIGLPVLWPGAMQTRVAALERDRLIVSFIPPGAVGHDEQYVYRLGADDAQAEAVVAFGFAPGAVFSWLSPDGGTLIATAARGHEGAPLWRLDLETWQWAEPRSWRGGRPLAWHQPSVSSDGRRVVMQRREDGPDGEPVLMVFDW